MTIFLGCILMLIATAIQTAAQNIGMFIGESCLVESEQSRADSQVPASSSDSVSPLPALLLLSS
jgi:hypothetical protein